MYENNTKKITISNISYDIVLVTVFDFKQKVS